MIVIVVQLNQICIRVAAITLASSTHQQLAALENNEPATVGTVAANTCGHDVLDVLNLKPHLAHRCPRANRADRAQKSIVVLATRKIGEFVLAFAAVSVRYRLKWGRFWNGAERNHAMVPLEPAGKKDPLIRQATGGTSRLSH